MEPKDLLLDAYGRIRENIHRALDGLTAEELAYRPEEHANSAAWLVWHLTRIQDDHVSEIAGEEQAWASGPWARRLGMQPDPSITGFGHTSEQVAAVRPDGPDVLLEYHDTVADRTARYLATVTPDELDRVIDERYTPVVTVGVRLVSVIGDNTQHAGQARYVRGIIERRLRGQR
ncbi:MAG: mycothiol transferase [Chloroflexota bacterium]